MIHEKIKDEFRNYMLNIKKLNENSVVQYLDVIDYTSNDAINDGILDKSIYEYYDADEVKNILETLRQNDHFNTITFKRNHINTAAIGNYIHFLEYRNSNNAVTPIIIDEAPSNFDSSNLEDKVTLLILELKNATNNKEKIAITKDIIRNCYEMMNYYK